jgi:integrase
MKKKYPEPWRRPDSPAYYFMASDHGRRHTVTTGCEKKEDARAFIRQWIDTHSGGTGQTFRQYQTPYFLWETCPRVARRLDEGKQIGKTHVRMSRALLKKWVLTDPIFPALAMREITRGHVLDLRKRLRARISGVNTLNKTITAVKTILSEGAFRGDIPADPGSRVGNISYQVRERGVFTAEEVQGILSGCPGEMKKNLLADTIITMLFCTGCRVGELRALRWGSVDLGTGRAKIIEAFKDSKEIGTPKWNKPREIALPRLLRDRLQRWRNTSQFTDAEDFVLANADGKAVGIEHVKNIFARVLAAGQKAKILTVGDRWVTPHAARHTLNTMLLAAGISPLLAQSFLGWSSSEGRILTRVQAQYTHLQLLRLEDVAAKIDELYGRKTAKSKISRGA